MKNYLVIVLALIVVSSCGPKVTVDKDVLIKEINSYASKVDNNRNLKKEVTEGALSDAEGFKDIGTFKYTVFYDETSNELFKIRNIEKTGETIDETFYFKNGEFVFIKFKDGKNGESGVYAKSLKDDKTENLKFYENKAKRFQKAFENSH